MKVLIMAMIFCLSPQTCAESSCYSKFGPKIQIDSLILKAIAKQESNFRPGAINKNNNGTKDIGLMQINSSWLKRLKKMGISEKQLFEPCVSIEVGSWILQENFKIYGRTWRAVGAYNAGTGVGADVERRRKTYANQVYAHYENLKKEML